MPQGTQALFVLLPCHCQYVAFVFMIAKELLNLQVLHPHSRSEASLPLDSCILSFQKKEAIPRDSTLYHWLELCHIATSDSKGDWGIEKF